MAAVSTDSDRSWSWCLSHEDGWRSFSELKCAGGRLLRLTKDELVARGQAGGKHYGWHDEMLCVVRFE
jgi:hypothetical protein